MINSIQLFEMALGVKSPWEIVKVEFTDGVTKKALHIKIDFKKGSKFPDKNGMFCDVYDTKEKTWKHLNFFQHECFIHCRVPRIKTKDGKVQVIDVPWARPGSGFTLLFEAFAMALIEKEMPINKIGELLHENPHRIWTIFNYWLEKAYTADKPSTPDKLGLDETSKRKGHDYITLAVNLDERRVIHIAEGKDKEAVKSIREYLEFKNININNVLHASMDMSPSFISGVRNNFPKAEIHFDRFHIVKLLNEAMDKVRQIERKEHDELKGHKYLFLKKHNNLSIQKKDKLNDFIKLFPVLGEAYRLKELFNDLWEMDTEEEAIVFLKSWCNEAAKLKIDPFNQFIKMIQSHWTGIVNFCETKINNGILEGINNKVQLAKRRARGYRCTKNFINMIYFLCGKLKFDYPLVSA
jgi:transposase